MAAVGTVGISTTMIMKACECYQATISLEITACKPCSTHRTVTCAPSFLVYDTKIFGRPESQFYTRYYYAPVPSWSHITLQYTKKALESILWKRNPYHCASIIPKHYTTLEERNSTLNFMRSSRLQEYSHCTVDAALIIVSWAGVP